MAVQITRPPGTVFSIPLHMPPIRRRLDFNTRTFAQRFEPVLLFGHVIEGPHQENEIRERIGESERQCIADAGGSKNEGPSAGLFPDHFHMPRHQIDDVHVVSPFGDPQGVNAGTSANVDHRLLLTKILRYQRDRPLVLPSTYASGQSGILVLGFGVVLNNLVAHRASPHTALAAQSTTPPSDGSILPVRR